MRRGKPAARNLIDVLQTAVYDMPHAGRNGGVRELFAKRRFMSRGRREIGRHQKDPVGAAKGVLERVFISERQRNMDEIGAAADEFPRFGRIRTPRDSAHSEAAVVK